MAIQLKINDIEVQAEKGECLLDVARRSGFEIPSLCHNEALPPVGACRVCTVEIEKDGRSFLSTACNTQCETGMEVTTDSAEIHRHRAMNLELLLARAPGSERIRALAGQYGVVKPRFGPIEYDPLPNCILCKLCIRACEHLGNNVLTMVGRGDRQRVGMAFNKPSESCTGCASCVAVCPTNCIMMDDSATERTIWGQRLPFHLCKECGEPVVTERQREKMIQKKGLPEDYYDLCENCKQAGTGKRFSSIVW
jgi:NADH dehydrogenase/NADH:ubiquinone oxidoreductase subunit G